ncbi:LysR family transcriptional regulator [Sphingomonas gilva]|uniref:LysR family transcriptional regulator n=1 Tax=Sphingomonas gilva TaxID=2305907 RepID=A0A396RPY6_9SPHN|nr:LysR family transcriptional regulator [Sphingomonas gilva]
MPPLAAVRVFEAAARHANFTRAAEELGMTQAGVSQQVRLLEDRLGFPLFARGKRGVALTEAGARIAAQLHPALERIATAFAEARCEDASVLSVSSSNTFAVNWLAGRLGGFQMARPDMAVRLHVSDSFVDFARDGIDVAVRGGKGPWPGLKRHLLMRVTIAAVMSPALAAAHGPFAAPADLARLPLLSPDDFWWDIFFGAADAAKDARTRPAIRLNSQVMEGRAAVAGQGVAIVNPLMWQAELASGLLVQPFPGVDADHYFWLVYPEERANVAKIRAFRDWILTEGAEGLSPPAPSPASDG